MSASSARVSCHCDAAARLRGLPGGPGRRARWLPRQGRCCDRVDIGDARGLCPRVPVTPRLLNAERAAAYLGVSTWTVRDLEAAGYLSRVRLPLPGGKDLRKLLYDRADLDRLIERSKDPAAS